MVVGRLFYGDNLDVLRRYIKDESIDLVYLDPPFNSQATYNVLFDEHDGAKATSQLHAFGDTWQWNQESARAYQLAVEGGGRVSECLQAFRTFVTYKQAPRVAARVAERQPEFALEPEPELTISRKLLCHSKLQLSRRISQSRHSRPGGRTADRKKSLWQERALGTDLSHTHKH